MVFRQSRLGQRQAHWYRNSPTGLRGSPTVSSTKRGGDLREGPSLNAHTLLLTCSESHVPCFLSPSRPPWTSSLTRCHWFQRGNPIVFSLLSYILALCLTSKSVDVFTYIYLCIESRALASPARKQRIQLYLRFSSETTLQGTLESPACLLASQDSVMPPHLCSL